MRSTLKRAQVFVYRIPVEASIRTSFGSMVDRPCVLLRLEDHDGNAGWGEVWCNFPSAGAEYRARLLASTILPLLSESSPLGDPAQTWAHLSERLSVLALQTGEPGPISQCLAGLESSLQDLRARQRNLPLYKSLSAEPAPCVGVYASGIGPENVGTTVEHVISIGFTACKIKVGFGNDADQLNVREARASGGRTLRLMVDANQKWSLPEAVSFSVSAQEVDIGWIEEPLRHDAPDELWRTLAQKCPIPLAAGENFLCERDFAVLPLARNLTIVQPDIGKYGGVGQLPVLGRLTSESGVVLCPHWLGGGIGLAASLHGKAASGTTGGWVEVDANPNPMRELFVQEVIGGVQEGRVTLSDEPGIGDVEPLLEHFSRHLVASEVVSL